MKCLVCGTIYPSHYEKCPKIGCGSTEHTKQEYAHKKQSNSVELEMSTISAFVEGSDIGVGEFRVSLE